MAWILTSIFFANNSEPNSVLDFEKKIFLRNVAEIYLFLLIRTVKSSYDLIHELLLLLLAILIVRSLLPLIHLPPSGQNNPELLFSPHARLRFSFAPEWNWSPFVPFSRTAGIWSHLPGSTVYLWHEPSAPGQPFTHPHDAAWEPLTFSHLASPVQTVFPALCHQVPEQSAGLEVGIDERQATVKPLLWSLDKGLNLSWPSLVSLCRKLGNSSYLPIHLWWRFNETMHADNAMNAYIFTG